MAFYVQKWMGKEATNHGMMHTVTASSLYPRTASYLFTAKSRVRIQQLQ
ncbi:hypothetical protein [Paenibacillus pseudetheri]|nr:hypothetical protein [Paenibacillus pseudetheri]